VADIVNRPTARDFNGDERGTIAVMFGLMLTVLTMFVGFGIDVSRMTMARQVMQEAVDGASLVGAKVLVAEGGTAQAQIDAKAAALAYFKANIKGARPILDSLPDPVITPDPATNSVVVSSLIPVRMAFMGIAGYQTVNVAVNSTSSLDTKDIEVGMALDVTGSMHDFAPGDTQRKIDGLKVAFEKFAKALMPATPQAGHSVRMGIAPFSQTVNLGSYAKAASNFRSTDNCVVERLPKNAMYTYSDATPGDGGYFAVKADNATSIDPLNNGPYKCLPNAVAVKPLTNERQTLIDFVNGFGTYNGTAGHLGAQWGWNIISEDYANFWGGNSKPAPYADTKGAKPKLIKAMILMTDGIFNTAYHNDTARNQALALCAAMRTSGVQVFTIGLGLGGDPVALQTLKDCASPGPGHFVDAANSDELDRALQQFASIIGKLRVSQ
jgi:Flp pilus assembly protein TadG